MPHARIILHVDMDAFFAAVEQRDRPELRGKPVIVGGTGRRGVVSTCSYEARTFGVRSAMPTFKARDLCPHGVFVAPRMDAYVAASRTIMEVFDRYSPLVEPLSLDEAFLDMTGSERLFGTPHAMGEQVRAAVVEAVGLTASVGVASTKFVAKVASDMNKPNGLTECPRGAEKAFLAPLPIERIWGVGRKAAERLHGMGLSRIGDVAAYPVEILEQRLGGFGRHIWSLANGIDVREVSNTRERKSVGAERTLAQTSVGREAVRHRLLPLADEVAATLRAKQVRAWGVRLKLKYADFRLITRDLRLDAPVHDAERLLSAIDELLERADVSLPMRLVGLAAFDLTDAEQPRQASLFGPAPERREDLEQALDAVRERFGGATVVRASWLGTPSAKAHDFGPDEDS
jgi:DNA polymerase-4